MQIKQLWTTWMSLANQLVNWVFSLSWSVSCLYKIIRSTKTLSPDYWMKLRDKWAGETGAFVHPEGPLPRNQGIDSSEPGNSGGARSAKGADPAVHRGHQEPGSAGLGQAAGIISIRLWSHWQWLRSILWSPRHIAQKAYFPVTWVVLF